MKKVLVITLYSGENEYEKCVKSVCVQEGVCVTHHVIENLPKQEAHQQLYSYIMHNINCFDFFAKLDADMAFSHRYSLSNIIKKFESNVDVVSATVFDAMTNSDMQSFNIFSNRCVFFPETNDSLFTDRVKVSYPGKQVSYIDRERNVLHAFDPSPFQSFMFGVHRALKVMQFGSRFVKIENSIYQLEILKKTWNTYSKKSNKKVYYALVGAAMVFSCQIKDSSLYAKSDYASVFEDCFRGDGFSDHELSKYFLSSSVLSLVKLIGKYRFLCGVFNYLNRKGFKKSLESFKDIVGKKG